MSTPTTTATLSCFCCSALSARLLRTFVSTAPMSTPTTTATLSCSSSSVDAKDCARSLLGCVTGVALRGDLSAARRSERGRRVAARSRYNDVDEARVPQKRLR
ncbi:hypothetical protein FA09DRAFT_201715 [Tilletiopsis washingtonensis]|uniref:Secreted protein n=1 Tax=Tilletiopsis washingtonensis TaxID=58919 RepID=A0A316ZI95_9BASI|nr:hypothetical protein FA09DRAFT_201715 [Tilletiopsis washingtonensis]PWO00004.1 hypothetical protein FA09DRAFT_201715 [Tilletiopsis washingtonensis]